MTIRSIDSQSGTSVSRNYANQPALSVVNASVLPANDDAAKILVAKNSTEIKETSQTRINEIKNQVEAGTYQPDSKAVAQKVALELL